MIWLTWIACRSADPGLVETRRALDAWTEGAAALEAGDPAAAQRAFDRALALRPDDALLLAWSAQARAASGDLAGALETLDRALALAPDVPEFRYNRAAWLARSGRPDEAAVDLRRALDGGARPAREVLSDPDFAPWRDHAAFGFLPSEALAVEVEAPSDTVFWGSEVPFRLRVVGAVHEPLEVTGGVTGPLEVVSAIEEVRPSTDGPIHDVTWMLRVTGAGDAIIGPLVVRAGAGSAEVPASRVACGAPPGRSEVPASTRLLGPGAIAGAWAVPSATRAEGLLWVKVASGDRVDVEPRPGPPVIRLERRENGEVSWTATGWRSGPATVVVTRLGAEAARITVP